MGKRARLMLLSIQNIQIVKILILEDVLGLVVEMTLDLLNK
jgi:hypothetical protein